MRTCRCGGENPNCYLCGGKGYLKESDLAPAFGAAIPKQERFASARPSSTRIQAWHCPICASVFYPSQAQAHLKSHRPTQAPKNGRPPTMRRRGKVTCRICRVPVKEANLARHMRRIHDAILDRPPARAKQAAPAPAPTRTPRQPEVEYRQQLQRPQSGQRAETRLDATAGMGHAFRDHGSFGSMPEHDRFDEESEP